MWKLGLVIKGQASEKLLDSYAHDRQFAADENIMNSTRSTDFITPKSRTSKTFRNQVLALAKHHPFARKLVNSGRLSMPSFLTGSVLNTPTLMARGASSGGSAIGAAGAACMHPAQQAIATNTV